MSKQLVIDIPEWAEERDIYVTAGIELLAFKPAFIDEIYEKTEICNKCGECCSSLPETFPMPVISNRCAHLSAEGSGYICSLNRMRPFGCCVDDPVLSEDKDLMDKCSIEYEKKPIK